MRCKQMILGVLCALVVVWATSAPATNKKTMELGTSALTTVQPTDATLGKYYGLDFTPPSLSRELDAVILELVIDVSAKTRNGLDNHIPVLEVYSLVSPVSSSLTESDYRTSGGAHRPIVVGNARAVRVDITSVVRDLVTNQGSRYGLVIGSLSGARDGDFVIKTVGGVVARVHLYYR